MREVMTPRSQVDFLSDDVTREELLSTVANAVHQRLPVWAAGTEEILGVLHLRDTLELGPEELVSAAQLLPLLREPYFVPESKPLGDLFRAFRRRRLSLALTLDEYGGVTGLVTMEDLLECIFGEIPSREDRQDAGSLKALSDGNYRLDGSLHLDQLTSRIKVPVLPELETLGGLLLHHFGELPAEGSEITIGEWTFRVVEMAGQRINKVHARRAEVT